MDAKLETIEKVTFECEHSDKVRCVIGHVEGVSIVFFEDDYPEFVQMVFDGTVTEEWLTLKNVEIEEIDMPDAYIKTKVVTMKQDPKDDDSYLWGWTPEQQLLNKLRFNV